MNILHSVVEIVVEASNRSLLQLLQEEERIVAFHQFALRERDILKNEKYLFNECALITYLLKCKFLDVKRTNDCFH